MSLSIESVLRSSFPGGEVNEEKLQDEVNADANIVPHCSDVGLAGDNVNVTFLGPLSPEEQAHLIGTVVPAHDNSPTPNDALQAEITNKPDVHVRKPEGNRAYVFGIDFCEKKTWYADATKVTDEDAGTGDGVQTVFPLAHGNGTVPGEVLLDLTRGLVTDDHIMAPPNGARGDYVPVVKVDGVTKEAREPYEADGGDYLIDFDEGTVTFYAAVPDGHTVLVTYWWVAKDAIPCLKAGPPEGMQWVIDKAEAQISADFATDDWFTDTIMMNVFHVLSGQADPANEVRYYTYGNLLDYSSGSFQEYPPCVGPRGCPKPTHIFRWEYQTPITLHPGFELRAWTKHGRSLGAARATVVMYALEETDVVS